MINPISTLLYLYNEDLKSGQTVYYTSLPDAIEYWESYHASFGEKHLPIELAQYLYDAKGFFLPYAERNNIDKNAVNFWIYATGNHITNALDRLNIDTNVIPKWSDYINVMKNHVEGAIMTQNTKAAQNIFAVLDKTIKQTKKDIQKAIDPNESILPFVIAGLVLFALIR